MRNPALRTLCFALCSFGLATLPSTPAVYPQSVSTTANIADGEIPVVPAPGRYSDDVTVRSPTGTELEFRFLHADGTPHTDFFLPVDSGIHLDGPFESEIVYRIELRDVAGETGPAVVSFLIDSLPPAPPRLDPRPGLYDDSVTIRPLPLESGGRSESPTSGRPLFEDHYRFFYRLLDRSDAVFEELPPGGVTLTGAPGTVTEYRVAAYAVDTVGNRSDISVTPYRIDRRREQLPSSRVVVSPVDGEFANEQLLYLDSRGLRDIEMELVRLDPDGREASISVSGDGSTPQIIPGEGSFRLTVAATAVPDGSAIRREVRWSQLGGTGASSSVQGYVSHALELPPPASRTRYTLDDTVVTRDDPIWIEPLALAPPPDSLGILILRYRPPGAPRETRITLLPDGRRAPPPEWVVLDEGLLVYALADTEIQWRPGDASPGSTDGEEGPTDSDSFVPLDGPLLSWEDIQELSQLRLRARYPGGVWTERVVSVPSRTPPPEALPATTFTGATLEIQPAAGEVTLSDLHDGSPILRYRSDASFKWNVPTGFQTRTAPTAGEDETPGISGGDADEGGAILVNAAPPAPPAITINANRLRLTGEGNLMYRVDGGPDIAYEAPVSLPGVNEALRRYRIEAYRIVDGRLSPVRRVVHTVDRRTPFVPPVEHDGRPVDSERILSNAAQFELGFANPFADLEVYYEVSTEGRAAVPDSSSPSTSTAITLETAPGEVVSYAIALRARFSGSGSWSPVQRYTVEIDRTPPAPPRLQESRLSTDRILIFDSPAESGVALWYRISPEQPFRRYLSPVDLDDPLVAGPLLIEAYTRDPAGNQTALSDALSVSPAADGPPVPRLTINGRPVFDPRITIDREVIVGLRQERDHALMWRIVPATEAVPPAFGAYTGEEVLSRGIYTVEAYSRSAGERRSDLVRVVLDITDEPIDPPELPFISYNPDGRSGAALWSGRQARQLFVSLSPQDGTGGGFMPLDGVFSWAIPAGETQIVLSFFTVDEAGRRSPTEVVTIEARPSSVPPRLSGAEDGGRYGENRRIELIGDGEIRYTLSTDGGPAPAVHALSSRYESPIALEAAPGEERTFRVRFRSFRNGRAVSEGNEATIIIDRRPPSSPLLRDIEDGGYYSTPQTFRLASSAGDRIMYRLTRGGAPGESSPDRDTSAVPFRPYGGEALSLAASELERVEYVIEAYTVDSAGNRSQGLSRWLTTIDTASIHVAAPAASSGSGGNGTGRADGSRNAPFRDLDAALRESSATGRSSLFLTEGDYPYTPEILAEAFSRTGGLTIVGGLSPGDWTRRDEWSHVYPVIGQELLLTGKTFIQGIRSSRLVRIARSAASAGIAESPEVSLDRLVSTSATSAAIVLESGSLHLSESIVTGRITADHGTRLRIEDSNTGELSVSNATLQVEGGALAGLRLHDGAVATVTEGRVEGTGEAGLGGLVYVEGSTLALVRSIVSDAGADVVLLRARAGHVRSEGTSFSARGTVSAVGLRLNGGSLALTESVVLVTSPNYAYGIAGRDTSVRIDESGISLVTETEGVGIVAGNSTIHVNSSILRIAGTPTTGEATTRSEAALIGISATGSSPRSLTVVGTSIVSFSGGTAVSIGPDLSVRIDDNRFVDWDALVQRSSGAETWNTDGEIRRVEDLNGSSRGEGNRLGENSGSHPDGSTVRIPRPGNLPPALEALRDSFSGNR
jgi:hypothetical protein